MTRRHLKRDTTEGMAEAERLFRAAGLGFECEMPRGRGHPMAVGILPDGGRLRIPVSSTPSSDGGAVFLVRKAIRKVLRVRGSRDMAPAGAAEMAQDANNGIK